MTLNSWMASTLGATCQVPSVEIGAPLRPGAFAAGVAIFVIVVWDAFEAIILPRRVTRKFRLTRLFYRTTWRVWKLGVTLISSRKGRETLLGVYGPISLLILLGVWAVGLVLSFALMQYGAGSAVNVTGMP